MPPPIEAPAYPDASRYSVTGNTSHARIAADLNIKSIPSEGRQDDPLWWNDPASIAEVNWDQSFPYQLALYHRGINGQWVRNNRFVFTLPIPPQSMSVETPVAANTTVTMGGVIEEHNGAPLRTISFSGTTGILPLKALAPPSETKGVLQSIFAGTLAGIQKTANNFSALLNGTSSLFNRTNLITNADIESNLQYGTGYFQFRMLQSFLEWYLALKKTAAGADYVMAIEIHKDQSIYLGRPTSFSLRRDANTPFEYHYSLGFQAWAKIKPQGYVTTFEQTPDITQDSAAMAVLLNKLLSARRLLQSLNEVLVGFRGDVNSVLFEPMRQTILFAKDGLGVGLTLADLPTNIVQDMKFAILEVNGVRALANQVGSSFANLDNTLSASLQDLQTKLRSFSVTSNIAATQSASLPGTSTLIKTSADPANKVLSNPADYFSLFEAMDFGQLNPSPQTVAKVQTERKKIRQLKRTDFETYRDQIVQLSADFADSCGAGSASYNDQYSRSSTIANRTPSDADYQVLEALNDTILEFNRLAASRDINNDVVNVMSYVAGLAAPSGITFEVPASKLAIPFPYGASLEQLAVRYLGDSARWPEIAILNNLKAPYVDEQGFDLPLVVPGSGRQVQVADASNLYVGQSVWLLSATTPRTQRAIEKIEKYGSNYLLTLDGDDDLNRFAPAGLAVLHAYLPNTVNSGQVIFIPSNKPEDLVEPSGKPNEALAQLEQQLVAGGIDLLLDGSGDLAITPDGDCKLAIGLANTIQSVRLYVDTPLGSLLRHQDYGLAFKPGVSIAQTSAQDILRSTQNIQQAVPSITGIKAAQVIVDTNATTINLMVGVQGLAQHLPLSFTVARV